MARSAAKKHRGVYEYPPGSDVWWVQYFVDGRRRREKVGGKQAAINRYQQRKTEAREGRLPTPQHEVAFESFVTEYLEGERLRLRAFAEYQRHGRIWIDRFGHRPLRCILPLDVQAWATRRRAEVEPATVNRELSFLRRVFSVAVANGLVERNPVKAVKFFHEPSGRVRFLTEDEQPRLREEVNSSQWQVVEVAFNTGLRQSEQFGLRWEHANLANRVLTIPRSKHGGARHVPLNGTAVAILRSLPSRFHSRWVFPSRAGKTPLNVTNSPQRVFNSAVRRAGIENFRWHDLRYTFASRLAMKGVDLNSIRELMGHKTLATTLRYAHLSQSHLHQPSSSLTMVAVSLAVRPSMRGHLGACTPQVSPRNPSNGPRPVRMRRQIPKLDVAGSTPGQQRTRLSPASVPRVSGTSRRILLPERDIEHPSRAFMTLPDARAPGGQTASSGG